MYLYRPVAASKLRIPLVLPDCQSMLVSLAASTGPAYQFQIQGLSFVGPPALRPLGVSILHLLFLLFKGVSCGTLGQFMGVP